VNEIHLKVLLHTSEVETDRLLVEVAIAADLEARVLEDGSVVTPRRDREVDDLRVGIMASHERATHAQSTGAGNGLHDGDLEQC
jgi:hypothetical protein